MVQDLLLDLMDLIEHWHQGLLGELQLVLSLGFRCIVLLSPESQLLVHCVNVVVYELDSFAQRGGILANTLDHALNKLELFLV